MRFPLFWRTSLIISLLGAILLIAPLLYLVFFGSAEVLTVITDFAALSGQTLPLLLLTLFFTSVLAYGNTAFLFGQKKQRLKLLLLLLPLSFPTYIMAFNWATIWEGISYVVSGVSRSSIKSLLGLSFVISLCLYPYVLMPLHLFAQSKVKAFLLQSKALHISPVKTFKKVILPLSIVPVSVGSALVAYELLNDYGAAKYYGVSTLTTQIFKTWFGKNQPEKALALALLLLVIVLLFKGISSYLKNRVEVGQSAQMQVQTFTYPKWLQVILSVCFGFTITCALVSPISSMLYALYFDWEKQQWYVLLDASGNSFIVALCSTVFTLLIVLGLLFAKNMLKSKASNLFHNILSTGYSIPGAVIAVGVLGFGWSLLKALAPTFPSFVSWVYGSFSLLLFGLSFKLYAAAVPALENGWQQFGKQQVKTIKAFLPFRKFAIAKHIIKPQLFSYYMAGALFVFIDALKELPLTLILRPFNFETLAVKAYNLVEDEFLYRAAPYSLIISIFCAIGIIIYNRLQRIDTA